MKKRKVVLKLSGKILDRPGIIEEIAHDILQLPEFFFMIVHGGGRDISFYLEKMGIESTFIDGLRVTDEESVEVVEMVLSGRINKKIVGALQNAGLNALGISGKDTGLFRVHRLQKDGRDWGFVGEIEAVNPQLLKLCYDQGIIPVISPISSANGQDTLNVNADHAASKVAAAFSSEALLFFTDVEGLYHNAKKLNSVSVEEAERLLNSTSISDGMVPKLQSAIEALRGGVKNVHILTWRGTKTLIRELKEKQYGGTVISDNVLCTT